MGSTKRSYVEYCIFLGGNALMGLLDLAMGAFIVSGLAFFSGVEVSVWALLLGAWLAVLPDHDIIWPLLWGHVPGYDHRQTLLHRPLLVIPVVIGIAWLVGGLFWALVSLVCLLWHYLHDTDWQEPYSGITWFWPLSSAYWSWWGSYHDQPGAPHDLGPWLSPTPTVVLSVCISIGLLAGSFYLSAVPVAVAGSVLAVLGGSVGVLWYVHACFTLHTNKD